MGTIVPYTTADGSFFLRFAKMIFLQNLKMHHFHYVLLCMKSTEAWFI